MTDPTWTADDVCSHGRPNHQDLIHELRESVGLFAGAMPITPKAAWEEAVARAGLLPAALDVIARMVGVIRDLNADGRWTHDDAAQTLQNLAAWLHADVWSDAERAVLNLAKDRRP